MYICLKFLFSYEFQFFRLGDSHPNANEMHMVVLVSDGSEPGLSIFLGIGLENLRRAQALHQFLRRA